MIPSQLREPKLPRDPKSNAKAIRRNSLGMGVGIQLFQLGMRYATRLFLCGKCHEVECWRLGLGFWDFWSGFDLFLSGFLKWNLVRLRGWISAQECSRGEGSWMWECVSRLFSFSWFKQLQVRMSWCCWVGWGIVFLSSTRLFVRMLGGDGETSRLFQVESRFHMTELNYYSIWPAMVLREFSIMNDVSKLS